MSPERVRRYLDTVPFRPFTIVKGDGEQVNVVARDLAVLHPGGRTLYVVAPKFAGAKTEEEFEDHQIDVFLITDLVESMRAKNGKKRH